MRAVCELERRGETEMDEEQTTDDLCRYAQGLGGVFDFEEIMIFQGWVFFLRRNGEEKEAHSWLTRSVIRRDDVKCLLNGGTE